MVFTLTNTIGKYAKNNAKKTGTWYYYGSGGGSYATSADGKNWVTSGVSTGFLNRCTSMAYANNIIVAAGWDENNPYNTASVSTNGTSWTLKKLPGGGYRGMNVAYGNAKWIVANETQSAYFHYSTNNGSTWTNGSPSGNITDAQAVAYGQDGSGAGLWVMVGSGGNNIAYSTTGTSFTANPTFVNFSGNCVAYGKDDSGVGLWVAGGYDIAYSKTGTSWSIVNSYNSGLLTKMYSVAYGQDGSGAGLWVGTGSGGNTIAYSSNGSSWSKCTVTNGFTTGYGVACGTDNTGKTLWIAVGTGGNKIVTSNDGINWTGQAITATYNPTTIYGVMFKPP